MNLSRLKLRPLTIAFAVLASIAISESFLARRNILGLKKDWTLAQEGFINPGLNVIPNFSYRKLLTGYQLRSDHLMGVQRLYSREEILPEKLEAEFTLGEEGYVDLILNGLKNSYMGIRLSSNELFPSMAYQADYNGRYIRTSLLNILLPPGKMKAEITEEKIMVNGVTYGAPRNILHQGKVGVQVSFKDTALSSFKVTAKDKNITLDFCPDGNRVTLYLQTFIVIILLTFVSVYVPQFILGLGLLTLGWQYIQFPGNEEIDSTMAEFRWLDTYWKPGKGTLAEKVETLREGKYFPGPYLCLKDGCKVFSEKEIPVKQGKRILLFGGSQFKHSLVRKLDESFHFRFDRDIRTSLPDVETMNINSVGLFSERLAKFNDLLPKLNPDEIILESLSFDHEVDGIINFIREWSAKGVKVIFLRRPVNPLMLNEKDAPKVILEIMKGFDSQLASDSWETPEVIRIMPKYREAQKEIGFVFLDPNSLFLKDEIRSSGELFWDGFHFTAYGQQLWAEWLAAEYLKIHQSSK